MTSLLVVSSGATAWTPLRAETADASAIVRVVAEPNEPRVTEPRLKPGLTVSRFVPSDCSRSLMPLVAPWPTLTSATTDATPMITPSIVRAVRTLARAQPPYGQMPEVADASCQHRFLELAVANMNAAVGGGGDVDVVRDEHDRPAEGVEVPE